MDLLEKRCSFLKWITLVAHLDFFMSSHCPGLWHHNGIGYIVSINFLLSVVSIFKLLLDLCGGIQKVFNILPFVMLSYSVAFLVLY